METAEPDEEARPTKVDEGVTSVDFAEADSERDEGALGVAGENLNPGRRVTGAPSRDYEEVTVGPNSVCGDPQPPTKMDLVSALPNLMDAREGRSGAGANPAEPEPESKPAPKGPQSAKVSIASEPADTDDPYLQPTDNALPRKENQPGEDEPMVVDTVGTLGQVAPAPQPAPAPQAAARVSDDVWMEREKPQKCEHAGS